jgi:hypothetical protein
MRGGEVTTNCDWINPKCELYEIGIKIEMLHVSPLKGSIHL